MTLIRAIFPALRHLALLVLALAGSAAFSVTSAQALPAGRHYEMVSPVYKQGYGVLEARAVEPGGESVSFTSHGGFAGALAGAANFVVHDYLARRGHSGWSTVSFEPAFGGLVDVSANLEYGLASGPLGPNLGTENYSSTEQEFQLHRADVPNTAESWEVFGGLVMKRLDGGHLSALAVGASADLCHVVVGSAGGALLPEAENTEAEGQIYDLARSCGGEPSLRLIGVNNNETPTPINRSCPVVLGSSHNGGGEQTSDVNAVDASGDEMFFTTNVQDGASRCFPGSNQLFVRLGGRRTVEVSRPLEGGSFGGCVRKGVPGEVPCEGALTRASAQFKGASEDGSRVFFTTTAPLAGEGEGSNLYMATIGCPGVEPSEAQSCESWQREVTSLVRVSQDTTANQAAEVQGVVKIAADGARVYFGAGGVLSEGANTQGRAPVRGADNLYVYDSVSRTTTFVADLCSGPARSGVVEEAHCPRGLQEGGGDAELLWGDIQSMAQSTANGAFLLFDSYARLLPGDTDDAKDVYRYDAQTGALERVSVGVDGYDANGNSDFDASSPVGSMGVHVGSVVVQHEMATRAISEDGSRIVFETAEPLSPDAHNHLTNIYEWHDGSVSLISSGVAEKGDQTPTITASGRDIFFVTSQGLVRQDTDGQPDIYDARLGEGFAPQPAERQRCEGEACYGRLSSPMPLLVPGSVSQAAGENLAAPALRPAVPAKKAKPKKKVKRRGKVKRKGKASRKPSRASRAAEGSRR